MRRPRVSLRSELNNHSMQNNVLEQPHVVATLSVVHSGSAARGLGEEGNASSREGTNEGVMVGPTPAFEAPTIVGVMAGSSLGAGSGLAEESRGEGATPKGGEAPIVTGSVTAVSTAAAGAAATVAVEVESSIGREKHHVTWLIMGSYSQNSNDTT